MNKFKVVEHEVDGKKIKRIDYFNEHWYPIPGVAEPLPSVTAVIGSVLAKGYGFEQWLRDVGNESKFIVREAAESGSKIHDAIETLLKGGKVNAEEGYYTKEEWKKLNDWITWFRGLKNVKVIDVEAVVYNVDMGVAGTVDAIMEIDGVTYIVDWKTGKSIHDGNEIQVGGAYFKMANLMGYNATKAMIVHVGAKNRAGIKEYDLDVEEKMFMFENILGLYKKLFPNKKAPTSEYPLELSLK